MRCRERFRCFERSIVVRLLPMLVLAAAVLATGCDRATAEEHLARAAAQLEDGRYGAAVIELKNSLQKDPNLTESRQLLGEVHLTLAEFPDALRELERAYDLGAPRAEVLPGILRAKVALGRHQEVLGELEPDADLSAELLVIRGDALLAAGDTAAAGTAYQRALDAAPELTGAVMGLGRVGWQTGETAQAAAYFERVKGSSDATSEHLITIAEFELSRRNTEVARATFERSIALPGMDVPAWLGIARTHLAERNVGAAAQAVERVRIGVPRHPVANYLDGLIRYQRGDFDGAEAALRRVHRFAPDHAQTTLLLGVIKVHQRQFGQAQDLLQRSLARDRTNLIARKMLASVHLEEGRPQRAIEVLQSQPEELLDAEAWTLLGTARMRAGDVAAATAAFQSAIRLAPDTPPGAPDPLAGIEAEVDLARGRGEAQMMLVVTLLREGRVDEALTAATQIIEDRPDSPLGYNFLGAVHTSRGDLDAAMQAFSTALDKDPDYHAAAINLAQLELRRGDNAAADARYQDVLARDADNLTALLGLAQMALNAGERDRVDAYLSRAARAHPRASQPRLLQAQLAYVTGDRDGARRHLDELTAIDPENLPGLVLRAQLDLDAGRREPAATTAEMLQRRFGEMSSPDTELLFRLAQIQRRLGNIDAAQGNLARVLAATDHAHAGALVERVTLQIRQDELDQAARSLERLESAGAERAVYLLLDGDLKMARDQREAAIARYHEAVNAGSRDAVFRLAAAYNAAGDGDAVVAVLQAQSEANPDDVELAFSLASSLLEAGRLDEARPRYEALKERLPSNPVVLNNLAWIYFMQDDDRAVAVAERALAEAPDNPAIMDTLGWILLHEGRIDRAIELLEQAAVASQGNPTIQYHLAAAHRQAGDTEAARSVLRGLLDNGTQFPELDEARALLAELE